MGLLLLGTVGHNDRKCRAVIYSWLSYYRQLNGIGNGMAITKLSFVERDVKLTGNFFRKVLL